MKHDLPTAKAMVVLFRVIEHSLHNTMKEFIDKYPKIKTRTELIEKFELREKFM